MLLRRDALEMLRQCAGAFVSTQLARTVAGDKFARYLQMGSGGAVTRSDSDGYLVPRSDLSGLMCVWPIAGACRTRQRSRFSNRQLIFDYLFPELRKKFADTRIDRCRTLPQTRILWT